MYRRSTVHLNGKKNIFLFLDGKFRIGNKIKRIIRMLLLEEITVMKKFCRQMCSQENLNNAVSVI